VQAPFAFFPLPDEAVRIGAIAPLTGDQEVADMNVRHLRPLVVALVALALTVGAALAASPLPNPTTSGDSASPTSQASDRDDGDQAEPTEKPEASEKPDAPEKPEAPESAGAPSSAELAKIVAALADHGITTTTDELASLASKVGVGGAVRVLLIAHAANKTPAEILAMFESGMGWGQIVHQLGLSINPGIGDIMGNGHGHGQGNGHGHGQGGQDDSGDS
jgi:hypothetical protein